jgi:hypothetical protein
MVRVYKIKNFDIYSNKNGAFIVYNTNKSFEKGHTHINNYHTAKYIANLAVHQSLPKKNISKYLIQSLIRISSDKNYIKKLNMMRN